jgi:trehalose 6-phosphate phosphatase
MDDLLAPLHRETLERYVRSRAVLGLDFDGTLAPIVADRERATMRVSTHRLLRAVAHRYPCVVLSGRSRADVARRLRGVPVVAVIGSHGLDRGRARVATSRKVRRWLAQLKPLLHGEPGIVVEDKGLSLAIHYRAARRKERARDRVVAAVATLRGIRLVGGKDVLNVLPAGAPHKGLALARERKRLRCDTAIYLGDDDTDEDVFALGRHGWLLAVRVGRKAGSAASHFIRGQRDIDRMLRLLLELRPPTAHGRSRRRAT